MRYHLIKVPWVLPTLWCKMFETKYLCRGEKQRMHLRDGFLADQLDPIYVAYNM